jgi:hypothetical protein
MGMITMAATRKAALKRNEDRYVDTPDRYVDTPAGDGILFAAGTRAGRQLEFRKVSAER